MDGPPPTNNASPDFIMVNSDNTPVEGSPQPPTHPNNPSTVSSLNSNIQCPHCNTINPSFFDSCTKCGNPLTFNTSSTPMGNGVDHKEDEENPPPPPQPPMPPSESQYQPEPPQYIITQPKQSIIDQSQGTIAQADPYPQAQPPPFNPAFDNTTAGQQQPPTQYLSATRLEFEHNTPRGTAASDTPGSYAPYETQQQQEPELGHRYTQFNPNNANAYHLNAPVDSLYPTEEQLFGNFFIRTISIASSLIAVTLLSFHLWFATPLLDDFTAAQDLSAMGMIHCILIIKKETNQE